ncbi:MAG: tyrosine-type recombinase/integrase [Devosia sp.]|nr:tyrosine-type recombinase/integrase [Devosia sp.]
MRQVRAFTTFLGLPPDRAEPEDLRRYQLHLASLGVSYARMNLACTALRFFFHVTLGRTGFGDRMARIPTPERLPVVLDTQEVALLLAYARSLKDRAALSIAYGCGPRVSEIANLKVTDIDSARMLIRVEQGIHRDDLVVEAGKAALILGDELRIERRLPIAPNLQFDPAGLGRHRLATVAVAAVTGLVACQMVIHPGVQGPLGERLLQIVEQPVRVEGGLGVGAAQKLVQKRVRKAGGFASCHR